MSRLEQTDRIARFTLVTAVVAGCISPFALGALKEAEPSKVAAQGPVAQVGAAAPVRVKGAMFEEQYLQPLAMGSL